MSKQTKKLTKEEEIDRVNEIINDYKNRASDKRAIEESWLLNINFLLGNQFCRVARNGEITEDEKLYPFESREVFNHIAPIIESRLAKLGRVRPKLSVRPSSASEKDKEIAKLSRMVLEAEMEKLCVADRVKEATVWSEVTGSAIYKLTHDENGELELSVVSPFEIFPESSGFVAIEDNPSIIHARGIDRELAEEIYGVSGLKGEEIMSLSLDGVIGGGFGAGFGAKYSRVAESVKSDQVLVIERYHKPTQKNKEGWLEVVVGGRLVYDGVLPLGEYPFIKQESVKTLGSFWGASVIERCIPVQRAYNGVKNRKLEYLSRLSSGVLAVEEGSVDVDMLEAEGLAPGKILVYRNGSMMPRFMDGFTIPPELNREEDRLVNELNTLAGVSELMRNSLLPTNVTSGTAINQLTEADNTRLSITAENIRESLLTLSKLILRVVKKFKTAKNISRLFDERGNAQLVYWTGSDLKADDVVLDSENELADSVTSRRERVMELFRAGVFHGENGKLDAYSRAKLLDALGFGVFESGQDLTESHLMRARGENLAEKMMVLEVDDHLLHIKEHTRYLVESVDLDEERVKVVLEHIRTHKTMAKVENIKLGE